MLKKVKFLNYEREYTYSPHIEDCLINMEDIQSIKPADSYSHRVSDRIVKITFINGKTLICVGEVEDYDIS